MKSDKLKTSIEALPHRALLLSSGLKQEDFEKEDFDVWFESEEVYNVKEKVEQLGKKVLLKGFKLRMQKVKEKRDYIGCNIWEDRICKKLKKRYYDVPHFSIGLVRANRSCYSF